MILTRRFGALRARPVFPSVTEQDEELTYFGDVRQLDQDPRTDASETGESAA